MRPRLYQDAYDSPIGALYITFAGEELTAISFGRPSIKQGKIPNSFRKQLMDYFEGRLREFTQEILFLEGTEFEKKVWLSLRDVPYGETRTYKWIAEKIERPKAVRAVGQALSRNPIPIVLPCHRIIESDGHIGGYSSGVGIKRRLLDMEYYYSMK
jgi:methylated-DNA-[protein]-cysteine S-methyltransferase